MAYVLDMGDLELALAGRNGTLPISKHLRMRSFFRSRQTPISGWRRTPCNARSVPRSTQKYPDVHIIHFDAHTDLRDDYLGRNRSPMPVSFAVVGTYWRWIESSNLGFAPETAKNGVGAKSTFIHSGLIWKDSEKPLKRLQTSRYILHWISTYWTRPYSRNRHTGAGRHLI